MAALTDLTRKQQILQKRSQIDNQRCSYDCITFPLLCSFSISHLQWVERKFSTVWCELVFAGHIVQRRWTVNNIILFSECFTWVQLLFTHLHNKYSTKWQLSLKAAVRAHSFPKPCLCAEQKNSVAVLVTLYSPNPLKCERNCGRCDLRACFFTFSYKVSCLDRETFKLGCYLYPALAGSGLMNPLPSDGRVCMKQWLRCFSSKESGNV